MSHYMDYTNGAIHYVHEVEDVKSQFVIHAYDDFQNLCNTLKLLIQYNAEMYETLSTTAKSKLERPDFESAQTHLMSLLERFEATNKRVQEILEAKPEASDTVTMVLTAEELAEQEARSLQELEESELLKLKERSLDKTVE